LICAVDFVQEQSIVFVRLENAVELQGMLEIKLYSRFIVLIIGPEESERQLLQIGRSMATILTDDICREFAYTSKNADGIVRMMDRFMQDTYVIPPSEWDPTIRIEPPQKYMSKVRTMIMHVYLSMSIEYSRNNGKHKRPMKKLAKSKKSI
jgi:hypothetical protein